MLANQLGSVCEQKVKLWQAWHVTVDDFFAVVPAGGAGTRLWPLSRRAYPKFLHDFTGAGRTLLQQTWDRLVPLSGPDRVMLVAGQVHGGSVSGQLPDLPGDNLVLEPSPKDSMAAIGLAAALLVRRNPDAVMGSFAADHTIADPDTFRSVVCEAIAVARTGELVTIGIDPTWPSSGFGYIRSADPLSVGDAPHAVRVAEFVEKPDSDTAKRYLQSGEFYWNAGMFVVRAQVLLEHLAQQLPDLYDGVVTIAETFGTSRWNQTLADVWPGVQAISIDHAIAEPVAANGGVAVVPGDFGWDDVGDWRSVGTQLPPAEPGEMQVLGDKAHVIARDATGLVVPTSGRLVAVLGVDDIVVVDTDDAVFVGSREHAQEVKNIVSHLKSERVDLT